MIKILKKNSLVFILLFSACNQPERKQYSAYSTKYYQETNKCVKSIITTKKDSISCLECFINLSKKYPDSLNPYLFVADEYRKVNDQDKLNRIYIFLKKKFGNRTKILYHKNFYSVLKFKKYDRKELNILRDRKTKGLLTEQQNKDMGFLEMLILASTANNIIKK